VGRQALLGCFFLSFLGFEKEGSLFFICYSRGLEKELELFGFVFLLRRRRRRARKRSHKKS